MATERHCNHYTEEWIDRNAIKYSELEQNLEKPEGQNSHDVGLADSLLEACTLMLRELYKTAISSQIERDETWEEGHLHDLKECVENLYLWGQSACPLQIVITESSSLHDTVMECLFNIGTLLGKL